MSNRFAKLIQSWIGLEGLRYRCAWLNITVVAILVSVLLTGCLSSTNTADERAVDNAGNIVSQPSATPPLSFSPTSAVEISATLPSTSTNEDTSGAPPFTDPGELANYLFGRYETGDWPAVQAVMTEEFQQLNAGAIGLYAAVQREFTNFPWEIEEEPGRAVARIVDQPTVAVVFVENDAGEWRYKPRPHVWRTLAIAEGRTSALSMSGPDSPPYLQDIQSDFDPLTVRDEMFRHNPETLVLHDEGPILELEWAFVDSAERGFKEGILPLNNVSWELGDEHGSVEVVHTTAVRADDELRFPVPPAYEEFPDQTIDATYFVSFRLLDLPPDWEGTFTLRVNDLAIVQDQQTIDLDLEYEVPRQEFPTLSE